MGKSNVKTEGKFLAAWACAVCVIVIGLAVTGLWSYSHFSGAEFSRFAEARFNSLLANVEARELAGKARGLDGIYAGHYGRLVLSENSFAHDQSRSGGCFSAGYNHGAVELVDGAMEFEPSYVNSDFSPADPSWPVRWKSDLYLVKHSDLIEFCSFVNGATDLRFSPFFKREHERENSQDFPRPTVPKEFEKYLLEDAVHARMKRIEPATAPPDIEVRVTLASGSDDGLLAGMQMRLCGYPNLYLKIESSTTGELVGRVPSYAARELEGRVACFSTGTGHASACEFTSDSE